ncbi:hypothetical protein WR25_06900 [Diploscapter pachys]|uniref:Uncharacterized protein n=1 Tax=Diploscapter pachys TaxID=2018661 RepID=A0A2A2L455_9BILA|nr:hypothetical protein WR25_06900 [Diploscapter pachys]
MKVSGSKKNSGRIRHNSEPTVFTVSAPISEFIAMVKPLMKGEKPRTVPQAWTRFLERTTAHGLPRIANARNQAGKIFWVFIFAVFALIFLMEAQYLFVKYYNRRPITDIKV